MLKPDAAMTYYVGLIERSGFSLQTILPQEGIKHMLRFYSDERIEDCDIKTDGDMLLFQWGCNDWGAGEFFDLNITRQLIEASGEDENIRQLSMTFKFAPAGNLRSIESGNRWCSSPQEVAEFERYVLSSSAF